MQVSATPTMRAMTKIAGAPKEPPPALPRPVLLVHGYNSSPHTWIETVDWLTSNPANKLGGPVGPLNPQPVKPDAKVFTMNFSRGYNGVEKNARELKEAIERITAATGSPDVDIVAHSMGGLDTREYLNDPEEKVNRFVMIATPNKGSQLANLELVFREKLGFPLLPPADDPEVRTALHNLTVDKKSDGVPQNPFLHVLNQGWNVQKGRAHTLIYTGNDIPTLTGSGIGITLRGDGVVANKSADMTGVDIRRVRFNHHGSVLKNDKIMQQAANFLATGKAPELKDEAPVQPKPLSPVDPGELPITDARGAVHLPILDPAFQLALAMGGMIQAVGASAAGPPTVAIHVASQQNGTKVEADYEVHSTLRGPLVTGTGTAGDEPVNETATWQDGQLVWDGKVGGSRQQLAIRINEDDESLTMVGTMGKVNTEIKIDSIVDAQGMFLGSRSTGHINGEPFAVDTLVKMPGGSWVSPQASEGLLQVRGHLNGETVEKNYQVSSTPTDDGFVMNASGNGLNAGSPQSVELQIKVKDPNKRK